MATSKCDKCDKTLSLSTQLKCMGCWSSEKFCSQGCLDIHQCLLEEKKNCPCCGEWIGKEVWYQGEVVPKCLKCCLVTNCVGFPSFLSSVS